MYSQHLLVGTVCYCDVTDSCHCPTGGVSGVISVYSMGLVVAAWVIDPKGKTGEPHQTRVYVSRVVSAPVHHG